MTFLVRSGRYEAFLANSQRYGTSGNSKRYGVFLDSSKRYGALLTNSKKHTPSARLLLLIPEGMGLLRLNSTRYTTYLFTSELTPNST